MSSRKHPDHEPRPAHEVPGDNTFAVIDHALRIQRPIAAKYIASQRAKHPGLDDDQLVARIERSFVSLMTVTGAGVGGTAVLPGVGTVTAVALTAGEGAAFAEACAFLTLAVAEVRGVDMSDPERRRAVALGVLGGEKGEDIMAKALGKQGVQWSGVLSGMVPEAVVRAANGQVRRWIKRKVAARLGSVWAGRLIPFGVGAVVGGVGNLTIARGVVEAEREIFAQAPSQLGRASGSVGEIDAH